MTEPRPAPYPTDTRAKGWRFELDYEQIERSDTWSLAAELPMCQHALLMMWLMAWTQQPCGSLPADEALIRAKCRIPQATWSKCREVLMRGWWLADDGRRYHDTLVTRVGEMMKRRRSDSGRQAAKRAKDAQDEAVNPTGITAVSRVTPTGLGRESSTDNRIPNTEYQENTSTQGAKDLGTPLPSAPGFEIETEGHEPTPQGVLCRGLKSVGLLDCNPGDVRLKSLLEQGATAEEILGIGAEAAAKSKGFAWVLVTAEARRADAARISLPALPKAEPGKPRKANAELLRQAERAAVVVPPPVDLRALSARLRAV